MVGAEQREGKGKEWGDHAQSVAAGELRTYPSSKGFQGKPSPPLCSLTLFILGRGRPQVFKKERGNEKPGEILKALLLNDTLNSSVNIKASGIYKFPIPTHSTNMLFVTRKSF